ncbi:MAG: DUF1775 domain-containing protein [Acidimicrobiia bacterium]|nr:DUF1775 domain-containing protein [Acidimicrobiia bacterium]
MNRRVAVVVFALTSVAVLTPVAAIGTAHAHTATEFVAVPAGSEAVVKIEPTHGCGESPTVEVRVLAPVAEAAAVAVDGWESSAEPYAEDDTKTVLTWTGGVLPADTPGEFPVEFVVPDTVGELLLFPAVQTCENGEELAWIDGDPESEFPAPRLLVLDADAEPAATLDDVPADAPGRDLLTQVVDVDNPTASDPVASTLPATSAP